MLSIYNFLKVKLCYRTYWRQWLVFLAICFLLFACSSDDEDNTNPIDDTNPVYLDENGITIKARDWAEVGMTGEINGTTYTIVDEEMLDSLIAYQEDVTVVCTTLISEMDALFSGNNNNFNQDISSWDVSNVTNMWCMFIGTYLFNQDISSWDVSNVTNMSYMFDDSSFNQPIGDWDVSNVTNMFSMFRNSSFNQPIGDWDVSNVTNMHFMFGDGLFNQPIGDWDVSSVTNMERMFWFNEHFNQDLSSWDVSNVTNIIGMFGAAINFNQDLSSWNVDNVTNSNCYHFCYWADSWTLPKPNFTNCSEDLGCD